MADGCPGRSKYDFDELKQLIDLNADATAIAKYRQHLESLSWPCKIWPENWTTACIYLQLQADMDYLVHPGNAPGVPTRVVPEGVKSTEIECVMRAYRIAEADWLEVFETLRCMFAEALPRLQARAWQT